MSLQLDATLRDPARVAALHNVALLDSAAEPAFDRLTRLVTKLLQVPTALVSLVDEDRQFFKSCVGLGEPWAAQRATPLSHSFCQYAVVTSEPFVVEDARVHPLVEQNLAIPDLGVVAYAGIPLITSDGHAIGSLCAIDSVPRQWTADEIDTLRDLTSMVMTEIELRAEVAERKRMAVEREMLLARERAARAEAERAQRRVTLLSEASKVLAASFAYKETLAALMQLVRASFVDQCALLLMQPPDEWQIIAPEQTLWPQQWRALLAAPFSPEHPIGHVLSTRTPRLWPVLTKVMLERLSGVAAQEWHGLQPKSLIAAPVQGRGDLHGMLVLAAAPHAAPFTADDLALAEELGRRAGLAIDAARLYDEALAAVRARNDVLAVVTHDLRGPLHVMQLYASVLHQCATRPNVPATVTEEATRQITRAGQNMSHLLTELMDVAQFQAGHTRELSYAPVDLVALARTIAEYQQQITARQYIFVQAGQPRLVGLLDRARIERVFTNLLDNAIKYSPNGGNIVIALRREQAHLHEFAVIEVQDHGLGIPAADLPHIWDQFFRAANVPRSSRGMGVGLASARQIVEQHGGSIAAWSKEACGTTITVRLPIVREDALINDTSSAAHQRAGRVYATGG